MIQGREVPSIECYLWHLTAGLARFSCKGGEASAIFIIFMLEIIICVDTEHYIILLSSTFFTEYFLFACPDCLLHLFCFLAQEADLNGLYGWAHIPSGFRLGLTNGEPIR